MKKLDKKTKLLFGFLVLTVLIAVGACLLPKKGSSVLQELREKNGYIRTVGTEEYEFFRSLVARDLEEGISDAEMDAKIREKINRTNAEFLLGNQMGLCGPYSFESFQLDMENENSQRQLKKQKNQVFYGPEQFDLVTYCAYRTSNLKMDMVSFVVANADEEILKNAKAYFSDHRENYRAIEKIEYTLTENEKTEQRTLLAEDFSSLEKTDSELFEFLYTGAAGDELEYVYQEQRKKVKIVSVKYERLTYKNNMERVMRDYVTNVYLEDWIREIEENYPVEIKFEKEENNEKENFSSFYGGNFYCDAGSGSSSGNAGAGSIYSGSGGCEFIRTFRL